MGCQWRNVWKPLERLKPSSTNALSRDLCSAGYSNRVFGVIGFDNLAKPEIQIAIEAGHKESGLQNSNTGERLLLAEKRGSMRQVGAALIASSAAWLRWSKQQTRF